MAVYCSQKAHYKLFLQTFLEICFSQNPSDYKLLLQTLSGAEINKSYLLPQT